MAINKDIIGTDPALQQDLESYFAQSQPSEYEKLGPNYAPVSSTSYEANVPGIDMPNTGNQSTQGDVDMFADIFANTSTPSFESRYEPDYFNWDAMGTDRFTKSSQYKQLGFDSRIGEQLNEERYAANQTAGDVLKRTFGGFASGMIHGAADMASHWSTLTSAIAAGDLGKLYSQEVLDEVAKKQKEFDNDWHIFQGESTGVLTKVAAGIQGTGHLVGAIGEMVAEQIALNALAGLTLGATSELNVAATTSQGARIGAMADKLSQALTTPKMLSKVWNGLARNTQNIGKMVPGLGNTIGGWGKLAAEGMGVEGSMMKVAGRGLGNFVKDMRSVNMATSFASGNASGVYQQIVNDRTQKYIQEHGGMAPDDTEMEAIKADALRAAKTDGAVNAVGMLMMENIAFGNLIAPRKLIAQSMEEGGAGVFGMVGRKPWWVEDAAEVPLYVKNQIKWNNLRASMLQWGSEAGNYGEAARNILKHSTSFGVTMNMMGAIDNGVKAWFDAKYDNNDISIWDAAKIGAQSQFTKEGAETFISGFLTGAFLHGMGALIGTSLRPMERFNRWKTGAETYDTIQEQTRQQAEEFVRQANRMWADPLRPFVKTEPRLYNEETDDTLHGVNDQNGFNQGMQQAAGTGRKKTFHDIEDDASREVLVKLMRNKLADAWVQRAKDYASDLSQDELCQMFNVDSTPENYQAIVNSVNRLEPRLRDLKEIMRQVDSAFKNPFNPYATDPDTGKRLYEDGSEAFIREWTDWKTHSGMKDYIIALKDKALRSNQRQKEILYGTSDSTGLVDMPFATDLGMNTLMIASSLDLLQNELNILQDMASNGDKSAAETIAPLREYQDVLDRYTVEYKDILQKGAYPERNNDIFKLNVKYSGELADKFHKYIEKTLVLKNMSGKVIDSKPLPEINDVRDAIERMMDYYQLQAEEGAVLMKINSLLDPKISRAFQDIYFREASRRKRAEAEEAVRRDNASKERQEKERNQQYEEAESVTDTNVPEETELTFQDREQEVVEYLTNIPEGQRFTYDNDIINSIPDAERADLIDEIESIVRTTDNIEERNSLIQEAVQNTYDIIHDRLKTQSPKEYPNLQVGVRYAGESGYGIYKSEKGALLPVDDMRYTTLRAANRAIDKYINDTYPTVEGTPFRVGEHISLATGSDKGTTYKVAKVKDEGGERTVILKETVPHYNEQGKEIGIRTTNKSVEVSVEDLNKNYVTGKVQPVIKKDQFNPNYPKASIPDAMVSIAAPKAGGVYSKESYEDKVKMAHTLARIPTQDLNSGNGFSIKLKLNPGTPKLKEAVPGNPQILYYTQQFAIELYYGNDLIGYVTNPVYYEFRPNDGKGAPKNVTALTIDDIKALFEPIQRFVGVDDTTTAQNWQKHLNDTYKQALQFLGKVTEGMVKNNISSAEITELGGVVKLKTVYSYDWIGMDKDGKPEVGASLKEIFDTLGIENPEYHVTQVEYIEDITDEGKRQGQKVETDIVINSTMSEEDAVVAEETKAVGQLGMYKAVIKLPNGEFHSVHLVPRQMKEEEIRTILDKVEQATDTESAKIANEALSDMFISLPVYEKDGTRNIMGHTERAPGNTVLVPHIFTTGKEPVIKVYINKGREESGKPIKIGEKEFTLASLKGEDGKISTDSFVGMLRSIIKDITVDNLKVQADRNNIMDMETSVTKNLFRDVSLTYEVSDPLGGERIIDAIIQQQPKKVSIESDQDTKDMYDTESEEQYQLTDDDLISAYGEDVVVPDITPVVNTNVLSLEGNEYDASIMEDDISDSRESIDDEDDVALQQFLEQQKKLKGGVPKISDRMQSKELSEQDVEDIDTFNKVIKETFPEGLISLGEIDTVTENMARNGIVVGQFSLYLDELGNVKGRIDTKAQNPGKYHESMHAVMRLLLTDEQYRETIDRAKIENPVTKKRLEEFRQSHPRYENMSEEELKDEYQEEFISDEYDKFATGHSKKMKLPWLQRLFNRIKYWLQYVKDLMTNNRMRAMFYEVKTGKYKNAKLQSNKFTTNVDATQAVPMIKTSLSQRTVSVTLPDGSTAERTNVFTKFLPEQEASQLLNDVTAMVFMEMKNQRKYTKDSINKAIDTVLNRYSDSFNILNPTSPAKAHLKSIADSAIRKETRQNLMEYWNIFEDKDNRTVIKEEIFHNLRINGIKDDIDNEAFDTEAAEVGDRNADTKFLDKQSGGYGSLGSNIKRDMAATFTTVAELSKGAPNKWGFTHHADGTPMIQGIDTNAAYAGMLKTLSDVFDPATAMKRLISYSTIGDNPNTSTYIDRVLRETGFDIDRFQRTGVMVATGIDGANRLNGILSAFMQQNKNYLNVVMQEDGNVLVVDANTEGVDRKQYTEWSNSFYDKYVSKTEQKGVFKQAAGKVRSALKEFMNASYTDGDKKRSITDQKLIDVAEKTSKALYDLTGVNLHPVYWQYSILKAKNKDVVTSTIQKDILLSYEGTEPIDYEELRINFLNKLDDNKNPFYRGDDESKLTAWEKIALKYAEENAKFDEDIDVTSHKNANNDTVYNYGYPSYNTVQVAKLNYQPGEDKKQLPKGIQEKMADPQTKGSHLLYDPAFLTMKKSIQTAGALSLQKARYQTSAYEGVDLPDIESDNEYTGFDTREKNAIDFKNFLPRDQAVFMLGKYNVEGQKGAYNSKGKYYVVPVSLGQNEAKSTQVLMPLPFEERVSQANDVLWKLTDKSKDILYNSVVDEVEQIKRAYQEIEQGQQKLAEQGIAWKKDYHDGKLKGQRFFRTREMMGEELSKEIEGEIKKDRNFDVATLKDRIEKAIQDNLYTQVGEYIEFLKEEKLIRENGSNERLPSFLFDGYKSEKINQDLGMRKGSFTRNLANIYVNEYINYMGITHLLYGDMRERVKNITDMWKRNAGLNGTYNKVIPTVGYTENGEDVYVPTGKFSHITFEDDIFTTIWGDKKERDDGQMYTDPYSYSLFLLGQGKLGEFRDTILKKMSNGTRLTKKEQKEILATKSASNPLKLVYDDAKVYMKSSVTPLFYEDVAIREGGKWVPIKGRERAFNILEKMVAQAKKTGQPVLASPVSVNKGAKENIVDINGSIEEYHWRNRDGQFLGNQVDNPTGKRIGVWPVQIGYQIMADQNANGDYYIAGKKMKGHEVITMYMDALAARKERTFLDTISAIYEPVKNKTEVENTEFNAGKFLQSIKDVLLATGSDSQTMELFSTDESGNAKYNINLAPLVEKAVQLYLSFFTKGGTQQKVPMVKFTMMSDSGFKIMRKALEIKDGEVTRWEVIPIKEYNEINKEYGIKMSGDSDIQIGDYYMDDLKASVPEYDIKGNITGYYTEGLRPFLFDTEISNQKFDDTYEYTLSSRIPGTSAHSNTYVKWVDTISLMYGDTAIYSKDVMTRDGHDKDLDKGFGQMYDTYVKDSKRYKYGSATTPEGKLEEFVIYQMSQNKELQRRVRDYIKADEDVQDLYEELSKKKYEQSDLGFQIKEIKRYLFDEKDVKSFDIITGTVEEISPEGLSIHIDQIERINKVNYDKLWKQSLRELKTALSENKESKREIYDILEDIKNGITLRVMRELKLPTTLSEFLKEGGEKLNKGTQTNIALSAQMSLLSSNHISGGGLQAIINRPTTTDHVLSFINNLVDTLSITEEGQNINPLTQKIIDRLNDKEYDQNGMLGQLKAYDANSTGKSDVGAIANMIQVAHILNQFDVHLRDEFGIVHNGRTLNTYSGNITYAEGDEKDGSKFQGLDTIAQMDVDAAKDHLPSRLGFSTEFTGYVGNMVALGMSELTASLYPLTKVWNEYKIEVTNSGGLFGEKKQYGDSWLNNKLDKLRQQGAQLKMDINREAIINYLKTDQSDIDMNYTLLYNLNQTRNIVEKGVKNISKILKMDNARNLIDFESIDNVLSAFRELGVGMDDTMFKESKNIPFDIRDVLTSKQKNIAENYQEMQLVAGPLSKKAFLSRQNISEYVKGMVYTNFNIPDRDVVFKKKQMQNWNSYISLVGLMKYLKDNGMYEVLESMNQDILWSDTSSPKNINTIVSNIRELKGADRNRFANSIAIVKPIIGKSSVTQANINTWVKMSEQMQRKLVDSFRDLVASTDENRYKAGLAFFNYLLVASGGQFRAGSYIRFTPEFMFTDWSHTMNKIVEGVNKDFETEDQRDAAFLQLFGKTYLQLIEDYMKSYATNINNKGYLKAPSYSNFTDFIPRFDKDGYDLSEAEIAEYNEKTEYLPVPGDDRLPFKMDIVQGRVTVNIFNGIRQDEWVDAGEHGMVRVKKGEYTKVEKVLRDRNLSYLRKSGFTTTPDRQVEFPFSIRVGNTLFTLSRVGRQNAKNYSTLLAEGDIIPKGVSAVYERSEFTGDYKQWEAANAVFGEPMKRTIQPEKSEEIVMTSGEDVVSSSPMRQPELFPQVHSNQSVTNSSIQKPLPGVEATAGNISTEKANSFVDILKDQITKQAYKENTGTNANLMFNYGMSWGRKSDSRFPNRKDVVSIDSKAGPNGRYIYSRTDQQGNPLPSIKELQPIMNYIQSNLGIDMSDYDVVIGNLYEPGTFISQHSDIDESKSAEKYPVIVVNLGASGPIVVGTDARNKTINLDNGSIYAFGVEGENRWISHRTVDKFTSSNPLKPITVRGRTINDYRITLTFRRAQNITGSTPKTPKRIVSQQPAVSSQPMEPTVQGENISSNSKGLAAALTNPTELAKSKGNLKQSYPITYKGKEYKDVEAAYQANKAPYLANRTTGELMTELVTIKLQTYPQLVQGIKDKGGLQYLQNSTHIVKGDNYWESGEGKQNAFMNSLIQAYKNVTEPTVQQPIVSAVPKVSSFSELKNSIDVDALDDKNREIFDDMSDCFS